ncbi:MAG: signal peptidase II [Alphaproteobacteria bacterium]|nr:signal peptidase II [Alphaproteobacteria bacterium]
MAAARALEKFRAWASLARANPLFWAGVIGALLVAALDQASKFYIVDVIRLPMRPGGHIEISRVFDLTFVENKGVSFGLFAGGLVSRVFLSLLALFIAGLLCGWLATIRRPLTATGVALIMGGAVGNLIDRALYGYVRDFLDFSGLYFPWVFNVADAAINVGIAALVADWLLQGRSQKPHPPES